MLFTSTGSLLKHELKVSRKCVYGMVGGFENILPMLVATPVIENCKFMHRSTTTDNRKKSFKTSITSIPK